MSTCFVMQPFDRGAFDQRYEEVYAPAIRDAELVPYRVDQDPKVSIPIQDIERGIQQARICLAEITLDNPNVWFELGYAIACKKEVVLICSDERATKFPFDVQHRTVIKYRTGGPSDFEQLKQNITTKINAYKEKSEALAVVSEMTQLTASTSGFSEHEVVALAAAAQNLEHPEDHVSTFQIKRDMEASGFTPLACTLALKGLLQKTLLDMARFTDHNEEGYWGYTLTKSGWAWVLANQERFALKKPPPQAAVRPRGYAGRAIVTPTPTTTSSVGFDDMDDDIPF
jgi:nucleoside 2-deoxyribosyltransferase